MLKEFKTKTEINSFFEELKKIALKAFVEGRKVEYQHFSSVSPIKKDGEDQLAVNTIQLNIWNKVISFEKLI